MSTLGSYNASAYYVNGSLLSFSDLSGITASEAEINILDGVTATTAELNILDGVTASTSELNILDGVVASATDINKVTGISASPTEMDYRLLSFTVTLGTATTEYISIPISCDIVRINSVIHGALTTADETLTFKNDAGTTLTNGVITIQQVSSAAGDLDTCGPTANNSFAITDVLQCVVGGENGSAVKCRITIICELT